MMRNPALFRSLVLFVACFGLTASSLQAQRPGDAVFRSSRVHEVNIVMTQQRFYDSLIQYKRLRDSTGVTTWMFGTMIFDGVRIDSVGVRLKGNSSFGYPGMKKPIKLKFNEYVSGQNMDGLKRLNFNNNTLDPSYMREKLFLDWMNEQGMHAPRCTYARVSYNGQYAGLFKIIEDVDKVFLMDRFGNDDGNLYKGDPAGSLMWMGPNPEVYKQFYELQTNETTSDWSDLVRLIRVINTTPPQFFRDSLEAVLHVESFIRDWAANNVFGNLDSYMHNAHNYFLYHNTRKGKFEWIAWDVSVAFGFFPFMTETQTTNWDIAYLYPQQQMRPLTWNIMTHPVLGGAYRQAVCDFNERGLNPEAFFPRIDSIAAVIRPHIYAEPDGNQMFPEYMFEGNINDQTIVIGPHDIPGLKRFIANRRGSIKAQIQNKNWDCSTTAIDPAPVPNMDIAVHPSPMHKWSTITVTGDVRFPVSFSVLDVLGRVVHTDNTGRKSITFDRGALPAGVYRLVVQDAAGRRSTRAFIIR